MFDTLPKTIENIKDVKPGDLVFIQAVYYNPKSKQSLFLEILIKFSIWFFKYIVYLQ